MTLDNIISEINWDNWKVDETYRGKSEDECWQVQVLLELIDEEKLK